MTVKGAPPRNTGKSSQTTNVTIEGENIKLPTAWYGTWGHNMPVKQVEVYTDGSRKVNTNGTGAAWAAILHDDAYKKKAGNSYTNDMGGNPEQTT
jgi:hypothetical protein